MTHRERALAAMLRQPVDRIPFIARMDLWYWYHHNQGDLPHPYEKASLWDIQRDLGIGIFGFGAWAMSFYRQSYGGSVEVSKSNANGITTIECHTPYGNLLLRDRMADELKEAAGTAARIEYPFKSEQDYDALQYLFEHTIIEENFKAYGQFIEGIGEDGLAVPYSGHLPAHQLMLHYMGYENFYLEYHSHRARVENLLAALDEQQRQILALAAQCPAEAIEVGGNYDEQMTPPPVFEALFAPFYRRARQTLSAAGKLMVVHGDGEMDRLLTNLRDCGIQVVEAFTPKPMTSIDIASTRKLWGDKVTMWGGIASTILTSVFSDAECEQFMADLFRAVAPGDGFILGFGDNVPTDAAWDRIRQVVRFWHEHGQYPLQ